MTHSRVINHNQFTSNIMSKFKYAHCSLQEDGKNKVVWGGGNAVVSRGGCPRFLLTPCAGEMLLESPAPNPLACNFLWAAQSCRCDAACGGPICDAMLCCVTSWALPVLALALLGLSCHPVWGPRTSYRDRLGEAQDSGVSHARGGHLEENWGLPVGSALRSQTCPPHLLIFTTN